jgi:hypothetical protein
LLNYQSIRSIIGFLKIRPREANNSTDLADGDAVLEPVHEGINADVQLGVEGAQPLCQILAHRAQILLAALEGAQGARVYEQGGHLGARHRAAAHVDV